MKAIILAAGIGRRLKPFTDHNAKCLLEIGGKTLIERYIESLWALGIKDIIIVVGHEKEKIMQKLGSSFQDCTITYLINEQYEKGSILSLWIALQELEDDALIMDADVLFPEEMLRKLIHSRKTDCFLMDKNFIDSGEEMKLAAHGGRVVEISKKIEKDYDEMGEGVGFLKLSAENVKILKKKLEDFVSQGLIYGEYEEGLQKLVEECEISFEDITGLPWIEIDFPEDLDRAEKEVLPRLLPLTHRAK